MPAIRHLSRGLVAAALLLALMVALWLMPPSPSTDEQADAGESNTKSAATPSGAGLPVGTPAPDTQTTLPPITLLPIASDLASALTRKNDPEENLQAVEQLIFFFRQGFGENPVGQNEDIVAMLLGENSKRAAFLPADCPAIKNGKLVDQWGSPYWFHPVSSDRMEIRSAGPDRDLFTGDDLLRN